MTQFKPQTSYKTYFADTSVCGWKPWEKPARKKELIETLGKLPADWALTPYREKRPFRNNWQKEAPLDRQVIEKAIAVGEERIADSGRKWKAYASGYGLRTGDISNGLLAIDIDGVGARSVISYQLSVISCFLLLKCLLQSSKDSLEKLATRYSLLATYNSLITDYWLLNTVSWTSGKEGRSQLLFRIPEEIRPKLKSFTRAVLSGENGDDLEIRYNGVASALPPSYHPETGGYNWIKSPWDVEVAEAPQWMCNFILGWIEKEEVKKKEREAARNKKLGERKRHSLFPSSNKAYSLEDILAESIARLDTDCYDWEGHNFVERGNSLQGCCPNHASESGRSFHVNTDTLEWFCFGCNVGGHVLNYKRFVETGNADSPTGKEFVERVKAIAHDANLEFSNQLSVISYQNSPSINEKAYQEYLEAEAEEERIERAIAYNEYLEDLRDKALVAKGSVAKAIAPIEVKINYPQDPLPTPYNAAELPLIRFEQSDRALLVAELNRLGWQKVLDTSQCGTGKSHAIGEMAFAGVEKYWLVSKEHRNPTVETIEREYRDLPTRHDGLVEDITRATPLGNAFLRNAKAGQTPDIESLCHNAHKFYTLQQKGYNPNESEGEKTTNPICSSCPHFRHKITENGVTLPKCAVKTGNGYGFMYARKVGLLPDKIRCSIDSLPHWSDRDYSQDAIIIDEADNLLRGTQRVEAKIRDIDSTLMRIARKYPDYFEPIRELIDIIYPYLSGEEKTPYYGLEREHIIEKFRSISKEKIKEFLTVARNVIPLVSELVVKPDFVSHSNFDSQESQYKKLASYANYRFRREAEKETEENIDELETNWLVYFLLIIGEEIQGSIRVNGGKLILDIPDYTHAQKLNAAKLTYIADATADKKYLARVLQVAENEIVRIECHTPSWSNLTVFNLNLKGLKTNRPSEVALARRDRAFSVISYQLSVIRAETPKGRQKEQMITDNPSGGGAFPNGGFLRGVAPADSLITEKLPVISHKSEGKHFDLFVDSRGTNRFAGIDTLAISGTPRVNLGDARAEYYVLYGSYEGFDEYLETKVRGEIWQTAGRLRAHLFSDRSLTLLWAGTDLNLDFLKSSGATVVTLSGEEIDLELGRDLQKFRRQQLIKTVSTLLKNGEKITQKAIAKSLDCTQGWISQFVNQQKRSWCEWKKILVGLLDNYDSSTNIFQTPQIAAFIEGEPLEMVKEAIQIVQRFDWQGLQLYLKDFGLYVRNQILSLLDCLFFSEREKAFILTGKNDMNSS